MGLQRRTWDYGKTFDVEVREATKMLIAVFAPEINEGFLLAGHGVTDLPAKGDKGTITFTKGGPTGGYWKWQPKIIQ